MGKEINLKDKVSFKTLFAYSATSYGMNVVYNLTAIYLMFFYTDSFGLKAASVGTLLLVARFTDAIADLFIGIMVDNTNSKYGRFKPYIFIGAIICTMTTFALFLSPDFSSAGKLVYAYITYIAWSISYSLLDIPYWSLSAAITRDPVERSKVVTAPRTVANAGNWTINIIALPLVYCFGGWAGAVAVLCALFFVCMMFTVFGVKENYVVPREETQSFKTIARAFFKENRPLRLLIITFFIMEMAVNTRNVFTIYYLKYNLNSETFIPMFMGVTSALQIFGGVVVPWFTKYAGKRKTVIISNLIIALSMIGIFFVGKNMPLIFTLSGVVTFFFGLSYVMLSTMLPDCVDYGQWKTGNRSEGMVFSLNIFKSKLAAGLSSAVGGYVLAFAGYKANVAQSDYTQLWILLIFALIPGLFILLSLFTLKNYEITEELSKQMNEDLAKNYVKKETEALTGTE